MLLRGTAIVSLLTLLSRCLGFVRDLLVARALGASLFADAFFVAFRIPNLLRSFAAEGALTSAFVPVFSSALAKDHSQAKLAFQRIAGLILYITIPMTIVGITFTPEILALIAPGFDSSSDRFALTVQLTRLMFPYIICVSLIAMINSALNTLRIFGASAWAQVIMNLVLICGAVCALPFAPQTATIILAISAVLGGITQVVAQVPACRRADLPIRPVNQLRTPEVREVVKLMIPATIGASVYQLNIFISTLLASLLTEGSISWLFYADRISQFPVGFFSVALASVLLPMLANASAASDSDRFRTGLSNSLRFTSFAILPMAGGIWALAAPLTAAMFERGAFTHHSTLMTAAAIQALAIGLWASSCYSMVMRAFIAKKDTITPTVIGTSSLIVYLFTALALMGPIGPSSSVVVDAIRSVQAVIMACIPALPHQGHVGLAVASSVSAIFSLTIAATIYAIKVDHFPWSSFLGASLRCMIATLVMIACVKISTPYPAHPIVTCIIGITIGIFSYSATLFVLRSKELSQTFEILVRYFASEHKK